MKYPTQRKTKNDTLKVKHKYSVGCIGIEGVYNMKRINV